MQFAVSLSIVLVLELSAAVASYTLQDNIINLLDEKINYTMHQYETNGGAKSAIDFLQSKVIMIKVLNLNCIYLNFQKKNILIFLKFN